MPRTRPRLDYDAIAHLFDSQPYRNKEVDVHLEDFLAHRDETKHAPCKILDLACGTGNQLIANHQRYPHIEMVGMDLFTKMLEIARQKSQAIEWVQGNCADLPFAAESFDYISCQYAFHHVEGKMQMLQHVHRILRPDGRFVLSNIYPQGMSRALLYRYFPSAWLIDLQDFWPQNQLVEALKAIGFVDIHVDSSYRTSTKDLAAFLAYAKRRDTCSQLMAISTQAYLDGLAHLEAILANSPTDESLEEDEVCLIAVSANKPSPTFRRT